MIKIAVNGCCGKMGRRIIELANSDAAVEVVVGLEWSGHELIDTELNGIIVSSNKEEIAKADVVIDFTGIQPTMSLLPVAAKYKKPLVIGTTGLKINEIKQIEEVAKQIPIVYSPNLSVGVNCLFGMVKDAAQKLKGYKVSIEETHHIHKKDSPSGTAKKIAHIIEHASDIKVDDINAIREGEIIGEHSVTFESELDTIVISHSAKTRDIFAQGAIDAAKWIVGKSSFKLYDMQDVIGK